MSTVAVGLVLVALVLAAGMLGRRLPGRWGRVPLIALAIVLALVGLELTRYDQGHGAEMSGIAFLGAPIVVIFGGALAGARRWYGYPDLGPLPGQFAAVASALLLGVLFGTSVRGADVDATIERGNRIATSLRAEKERIGAWPARLDSKHGEIMTRMGSLAPPPFTWDPATGRLSFPISTKSSLALDATTADKPRWKRIDR